MTLSILLITNFLFLFETSYTVCSHNLFTHLDVGFQLEKEMATHSSILAWRIPWTEELGGLQSMGCKESDTTERLHFHFHQI